MFKKLSVGLVLLVVSAGCSAELPGDSVKGTPQDLPITSSFTIKDRTFRLESANTLEEQNKGLKFRTTIDDGEGMLFTFSPRSKPKFVMEDVYVDLDLVFVSNGKMVHYESMEPCKADPCPTYTTPYPVDFAVELKGGTIEALGAAVGDPVKIGD